MKYVKELKNGNLVWIDTTGYREATEQEIAAREAKIKAQKAEEEKKKRINAIREQIKVLKYNLDESDKKQAKWIDGALSEEEYEPFRTKRQQWRDKINALEDELASL